MQRTLTASQLCSVNSSSLCLNPFQLWPRLLNSSQAISALLNFRNSFQRLSKLFHLFPPELNSFISSLLFSTLLNDSHLCPPRLNSSQLFSTRLDSSHLLPPLPLFPPLLTSAQLIPPLSQLSSTLLTFNSSQLFSPPVTEMLTRRASFYTEKHLHTASSYTEELLHTEAFTQSKLLHTASFCTEKLLHTGSFHTEKLLRREAFTQSKLFHRASFYTEKLLHKASFTHSKLKQAFTQGSFYTEKILHRAAFQFWNFRPRLARELLVTLLFCSHIFPINHPTRINKDQHWLENNNR